MKSKSTRWPALLTLTVAALWWNTGLGQESVEVPDNDGPYVYWHDSTTATVFCYCQDKIHEQKFENIDTLRFNRICEEEIVELTITAEPPAIEP